MEMQRLEWIAVCLLVLAGCDTGPKAERKPAEIFQSERQALEKAKGVEQMLDAQAEEKRSKMEEAAR